MMIGATLRLLFLSAILTVPLGGLVTSVVSGGDARAGVHARPAAGGMQSPSGAGSVRAAAGVQTSRIQSGGIAYAMVDWVNVRRSAGTFNQPPNDIVGRLRKGQQVRVLSGPTTADGLRWWHVDGPGANDGWVAEQDGAVTLLSPRPASSEYPPARGSATANMFQYVVRDGDTLAILANRYGTSVKAIMRANGLTSTALQVGQVLWIPLEGLSGQSSDRLVGLVRHVDPTAGVMRVQPGTGPVWTVYIDAVQLLERGGGGATNLAALAIGSTVEVMGEQHAYGTMSARELYLIEAPSPSPGVPSAPVAPLPSPPRTSPAPAQPQAPASRGYGSPFPEADSGAQHYTVQEGDTLYSIAQRFGTTVDAIRGANGIPPWREVVYAFQELIIP